MSVVSLGGWREAIRPRIDEFWREPKHALARADYGALYDEESVMTMKTGYREQPTMKDLEKSGMKLQKTIAASGTAKPSKTPATKPMKGVKGK